ncbi:MAG: alternate-type signal peptide domain-containing protein [Propionibacteriales bacterium]|nr:alternate-type signal peptide domain-containing protein [Propionibacteriales bacterium]
MKTSVKGALALSAAAVLLAGGAGTLAYWSADGKVDAGAISSGRIVMSGMSCSDSWKTADGAVVTAVVPGDVVTKSCSGTLTGEGENLLAKVEINQDSVARTLSLLGAEGGTADTLDVAAVLTSPSGADRVPVGSSPTDVSFDLTVTYPYGSGVNDDSQDATTAALDNLQVYVTQVR